MRIPGINNRLYTCLHGIYVVYTTGVCTILIYWMRIWSPCDCVYKSYKIHLQLMYPGPAWSPRVHNRLCTCLYMYRTLQRCTNYLFSEEVFASRIKRTPQPISPAYINRIYDILAFNVPGTSRATWYKSLVDHVPASICTLYTTAVCRLIYWARMCPLGLRVQIAYIIYWNLVYQGPVELFAVNHRLCMHLTLSEDLLLTRACVYILQTMCLHLMYQGYLYVYRTPP